MTLHRTPSEMIEISVVVPTYNRANLIGETLNSILRQSKKPNEIIVIDDGSKDNTEQVVRDFGLGVKYIKIENSGECRARNVGVSLAMSEFVAFCDSDDLWHPDKLMLQSRIFAAVPECEYSFTNFKIVTNDLWSSDTKFDSLPPTFFSLPKIDVDTDCFVVKPGIFDRLLRNQPIFPSSVMMKRSFFESVGKWDESIGRIPSVDLEFHLRCVGRGNIGVVAAPVVGIRKHASNFSGDPYKLSVGEVAILRYVLSTNPMAKHFASLINEQITTRNSNAAELAFAEGHFEEARKLLTDIRPENRSWKLQLKSLILSCPAWLRRRLWQYSLFMGEKLRTHVSR